ncbi:hypothetical protein [Motilimonas eburnea]|uniref:hypothetical protein n=1 Tax=Motilimonas eburnea TaxID=1737488 RepID=UPI001E2A21D2|nr:hypothetical protein [Motilimonas eburnea]MCE2573662.1 hypothetical protein [Motilimonas eburnea]
MEVIFDTRVDGYGFFVQTVIQIFLTLLISGFLFKLIIKKFDCITLFIACGASLIAVYLVLFTYYAGKTKLSYMAMLDEGTYMSICGELTDFNRTKSIGGVETFNIATVDFELASTVGTLNSKYNGRSDLIEGGKYLIKYTSQNSKLVIYMAKVVEC